jgi:hypothetical protein
MVETLYSGLLWGQDPRVLVSDLRRQLHAQFPEFHDWASIAAYASLPSDFDAGIESVQLSRVMAHINTAMNHADEATKRVAPRFRSGQQRTGTTTTDPERLLAPARDRMERARARLEQMLKRKAGQDAEVFGLLASTEKRQAAVHYAISRSSYVSEADRDRDRLASRRLLERARDHYWQSFLLDRDCSWAIVQYLSLDLVIRRWAQGAAAVTQPPERDPVALWRLALILSIQDWSSKDPTKVEWALGNLIELYVLARFPELPDVAAPADPRETASDYARELVAKAGADSFAVYSTRRQMLRYADWYVQLVGQDEALDKVAHLAEVVLGALPETANEDWD